MRIALAQVRRFSDPWEALDWLRRALDGVDADVVALPENWVGKVLNMQEWSRFIKELSVLADSSLIIGGSAYVNLNGGTKNICPMVSDEGLLNYSEKIFPSKATGERLNVSPGSRLGMVMVSGWVVGCIICVDALYPELVRAMALRGAHLIVNPSSISSDRMNLWRSMGLTRAFENSIFFASPMGTNYRYPDGREVVGGSFIAGPNGEFPLLVEPRAEGVFVAELDMGPIKLARERRGYLEDVSRIRIDDLVITLTTSFTEQKP